MIERISLNHLKFFYYAGLYGSVTIAAKKLFVTQSAVSKQIKSLEETLNLKLFKKCGRKLVLTEQGKKLYVCCDKIFLQLDDCLNELKLNHTLNSQLVLSCEPTISMKWLIPRLVEFNALNHGFEIVLLAGGGRVDFEGKGIDLAIRRNDFDWGEHIHAKKLADEYIAAVAKPNNQTEHLLLTSSRPNLWRYLKTNKLIKQDILYYEKVNLEHFYLCIEAALAGLGTAVVSTYMIEKEIANELLIYDSPPVADGSSYFLISRAPFHEDERKIIFKQWLKKEFENSKNKIGNGMPSYTHVT